MPGATETAGNDRLPVTRNVGGMGIDLAEDLSVDPYPLNCPFLVIWVNRMQHLGGEAARAGLVEEGGYAVDVVGPVGVGERGERSFVVRERWFAGAGRAVLVVL